jgi:hypothetical protein
MQTAFFSRRQMAENFNRIGRVNYSLPRSCREMRRAVI